MSAFRLALVTEKEFNKCLGEDRVAILSGSRPDYRCPKIRNRSPESIFDHESEDETELEQCLCPCPAGGMYNISSHVTIPPSAPVPPEEDNAADDINAGAPETKDVCNRSTSFSYFDLVFDALHRSTAGFKVMDARARDINAGQRPKLYEIPFGRQRKGSQTDPPPKKKKITFGELSESGMGQHIQVLIDKALFPAGSSEESLAGHEEYENELDSEWLNYSGSDSSTDYMEEASKIRDKDKLFAFFAKIPVEASSWRMSGKLGPLLGMMTCLGINPFRKIIRNKMYNYEIQHFSLRYVLFLLTFFITSAITGMSWVNLVIMFTSVPAGLPFSRYVEYLEVEKYWPYAFYHLISFTAVTSWSVIIYLRNGKRYVEYMNRWHLAAVGLKYDPFEHIAEKIQLNIGFAVVYSGIIIILYISGFSLVRDACGLFGLLLCRSFAPGIRTGGNYEWVRLAGLILHIYITFAEEDNHNFYADLYQISGQLCTYLKSQDGLYFRNGQVKYDLSLIGQFDEPRSRVFRFATKIPYRKLYAEHKVITKFARLTGKMFNVNFIIFFFLKLMDISFLAYRVITFMTVANELDPNRFEEEFLDGVYEDRTDKVRFQDPPHLQMICVSILFLLTLLGWLMTTLHIIEPGRSIHSGFGFVRRYGFINCTSSAMKRFLMSLSFNLTNPESYYFKPGFTIDRKFITYSAIWTFFFILQLLAFNPYKVTSIPVDICTRDPTTGIETCYRYQAACPHCPTKEEPHVTEEDDGLGFLTGAGYERKQPEGGNEFEAEVRETTTSTSPRTSVTTSTTKPTTTSVTTTTTKPTTTSVTTTTTKPTTTSVTTTTTKPTTTSVTTTTTKPTTTSVTTTTTKPTTTSVTTTTTKPTTTSVTTTTTKPTTTLLKTTTSKPTTFFKTTTSKPPTTLLKTTTSKPTTTTTLVTTTTAQPTVDDACKLLDSVDPKCPSFYGERALFLFSPSLNDSNEYSTTVICCNDSCTYSPDHYCKNPSTKGIFTDMFTTCTDKHHGGIHSERNLFYIYWAVAEALAYPKNFTSKIKLSKIQVIPETEFPICKDQGEMKYTFRISTDYVPKFNAFEKNIWTPPGEKRPTLKSKIHYVFGDYKKDKVQEWNKLSACLCATKTTTTSTSPTTSVTTTTTKPTTTLLKPTTSKPTTTLLKTTTSKHTTTTLVTTTKTQPTVDDGCKLLDSGDPKCSDYGGRALFLFSPSLNDSTKYSTTLICCNDSCTYSPGHYCQPINNFNKDSNTRGIFSDEFTGCADEKYIGVHSNRNIFYIYWALEEAYLNYFPSTRPKPLKIKLADIQEIPETEFPICKGEAQFPQKYRQQYQAQFEDYAKYIWSPSGVLPQLNTTHYVFWLPFPSVNREERLKEWNKLSTCLCARRP